MKSTGVLARLASCFVFTLVYACVLLPARAQTLGNVTSVKFGDGVELKTGAGAVRITVIDESTVQVRASRDGVFSQEPSWAVQAQANPVHPKATITDAADAVSISTSRFRTRIEKNPLRILFMDLTGRVVSEDDPKRPMLWTGPSFQVWKRMPDDEHYYGLGDKAGPLDRRNHAYTMWNYDAFGWQESSDPLYKDIPFFVALRSGAVYGIFFDNTWHTNFDFGKASPGSYSFSSDGGELNYYFFFGPDPKNVIQEYTNLTGKPPLPPLWALGYQQSRASYPTEARVREIARTFREKKIPLDAIYLDIDYQLAYRPFTSDPKKFPNFQGMIGDLRKQGIKTVVITDLHIAKQPGYAPYVSGVQGDHFVKNPDGSTFVGSVWPGDSVFPEFTRASTRAWWGTLYQDFLAQGVAGIWNDMNEPALFLREDKTMPLDIVHRLDSGRSTTHREVHNIYGMLNARATYEGLRRLRPDERPFVLGRATYAGGQRYFFSWTGDTTSSWSHMELSVPTLLSLGISGFPFVGDDISGFWGYPSPELVDRWMELGVFNPMYRNHSAEPPPIQGPDPNAGKTIPPPPPREPWVDGPQHESIRKKYIELRYRLLPYIYTAVEETTRTGLPLMRPLFLEYPSLPPAIGGGLDEFLFGRDMLVAPKVHDGPDSYEVVLPTAGWFDYWTGQRVDGTQPLRVNPALDTIPVYVRAGAIVPQQPVIQNADEVPQGPLELRVYPGQDCSGSLYMDDGHTFAYLRGEYSRRQFTCSVTQQAVTVTIGAEEGAYTPWWKDMQIQVFGIERQPTTVSAGKEDVAGWKYDANTKTVTFSRAATRQGESISIH